MKVLERFRAIRKQHNQAVMFPFHTNSTASCPRKKKGKITLEALKGLY
jgi:hypothetical protein